MNFCVPISIFQKNSVSSIIDHKIFDYNLIFFCESNHIERKPAVISAKSVHFHPGKGVKISHLTKSENFSP